MSKVICKGCKCRFERKKSTLNTFKNKYYCSRKCIEKTVSEKVEELVDIYQESFINRNHDPSDFGNYDAFYDYHMAIKRLGEIEDLLEPIPANEWNEDDSFVIWWRLPIEEPPYVGTPLCDDWIEDYYTHFTRLIEPKEESE